MNWGDRRCAARQARTTRGGGYGNRGCGSAAECDGGGWEGLEIGAVHSEDALEPDVLGARSARLVIELRPKTGVAKRCSRCGAIVAEIHDVTERRVRGLPILAQDTWLLLPRARVRCQQCGPTVEAVPWLDKHSRLTMRLAEKIARLAMIRPVEHVARWFGVHWSTVKQLYQRALEAALGPITAETIAGVRMLAIDEFAIQSATATPP